jgi:protein-tyrosine phosphatase
MAEGILRAKTNGKDVIIDSAGTGNYHVGEHPDARAVHALRKKGIDIAKLVARQFGVADFDDFDVIYAMDEANYRHILNMAPHAQAAAKVHLILNKVYPNSNASVPDPFYGGPQQFEEVYKLLDEATDRVMAKLNV